MSFNFGGRGGRQQRRREASRDSNRMPLSNPGRRDSEVSDVGGPSEYRIRGHAAGDYRRRLSDRFPRRPVDDYRHGSYSPIEPHHNHGGPVQSHEHRRYEPSLSESDVRPSSSAAGRRYSRFDPAESRNPFVNGAMVYRFVWGNPLCVRCGELGHLGNKCESEQPLSWDEQRYLRDLVDEEQDRSNRERERVDHYGGEGRPVSIPLPYRDERPRYDMLDQYRPEPTPYGMREEYERRYSEPDRFHYQYDREPEPMFYRDEPPRYDMPERYDPDRYHRTPPEAWPRPVREGYVHMPQITPHMPDADFRGWQEQHFRPASEEQLPPTEWRSETPASSRNESHDRPPLESQEDQFNQFKGNKKQSKKARRSSATLPLPPLVREQSIMETAPDDSAVEVQEQKMSKKKRKKLNAKLKREEEVNFSAAAGSAKANAGGPHIDHVAAPKVPSVHTQSVATPANAPPPAQLRLLPLGVNIPAKPIIIMGTTMRLSNGEAAAVGPHPSTIRVSARYLTQAAIEKYLSPPNLDPQERSQAEAREDSLRLQGVAWIDNVRRALQLPVKTYTSACVFYHKFRLAHPLHEYAFADAAAASLLNACKAEDTLKKSRDILVAAYNLKQPAGHEQLSSDDPIFDGPSRTIIGLERLVLESSSFDFTNRAPHDMLVKVAKSLPRSEEKKVVCQLAWTILTDIHRTFAPLKQTSVTLSLACLELAAHFTAATAPNSTCIVRDHLAEVDLNRWQTSREEIMEILLDALDMYTHHTTQTILGTSYSLDDFLRIRLALNKECTESNIPRHTIIQPPPSPDNANGTSTTLRVANGHPTPVSPPQPGTQVPPQPSSTIASLPVPEGGGTLRFMLNPQRATDERAQVSRYYTEEWEEYEEEIEVPITRDPSKERDRDRDYRRREHHRDDRYDDRRSVRDDRPPPPPSLRDRDPLRERERDAERERARLRERDRDRRYDDRRYDDRERDRRYDDRRDRDRDRDRRYYEDDRRRRDDRR